MNDDHEIGDAVGNKLQHTSISRLIHPSQMITPTSVSQAPRSLLRVAMEGGQYSLGKKQSEPESQERQPSVTPASVPRNQFRHYYDENTNDDNIIDESNPYSGTLLPPPPPPMIPYNSYFYPAPRAPGRDNMIRHRSSVHDNNTITKTTPPSITITNTEKPQLLSTRSRSVPTAPHGKPPIIPSTHRSPDSQTASHPTAESPPLSSLSISPPETIPPTGSFVGSPAIIRPRMRSSRSSAPDMSYSEEEEENRMGEKEGGVPRRQQRQRSQSQTFNPHHIIPSSSISPATSPTYRHLLHQRSILTATLTTRLQQTLRTHSPTTDPSPCAIPSNRQRNLTRASHNAAIISDLCQIVTDLHLAEFTLLQPNAPVPRRVDVFQQVENFVKGYPMRYALSIETPSEVLVHMRLVANVREGDGGRAAVHVGTVGEGQGFYVNETEEAGGVVGEKRESLRLVTICCQECEGLLESVVKVLGTGGGRVVDADVMCGRDGIVLDRFLVKTNGRLLIDKLQQYIETYLRQSLQFHSSSSPPSPASTPPPSLPSSPSPPSHTPPPLGSLYYHPPHNPNNNQHNPLHSTLSDDLNAAIPFCDIFPLDAPTSSSSPREQTSGDTRSETSPPPTILPSLLLPPEETNDNLENPIPRLSFSDIGLLNRLSDGHASFVYRAIHHLDGQPPQIVALKVSTSTTDTTTSCTLSPIDELAREAEIASLLHHDNICPLLGIAVAQSSSPTTLALAYHYCAGGSLRDLLSDTHRRYEYLPVALDIANGMAYLHSRQIIHRDLKPSNILLTAEGRAMISDFGMSVTHHSGRDMTGETGTYRWMAPEVIRHESYSTNADVYSFGIVLWQLVTRDVPFSTLTPVQTAYAVAEGHRPPLPPRNTIPPAIEKIITSCWDEESHLRPSFMSVTMALADDARMRFHPGTVGVGTLEMAERVVGSVEGCSTVNVDFSAPVSLRGGGRRREREEDDDVGGEEKIEGERWLQQSLSESYNSGDVGLML